MPDVRGSVARRGILSRVRSRPTRWLIAVLLAIVTMSLTGVRSQLRSEGDRPYTDPAYLTDVPWGTHSHWIQPWRAYLETVPARTFVDGLGMQVNLQGEDPDLVVRMLAEHGIRQARFEIGWGRLTYDETQFDIPELPAFLAAARRYGVRPLLLLNAHHGRPVPMETVTRTAPRGASAGATSLVLDDTSGLRPGYSGVSNLSQLWAAEALITRIDGRTVTLSKPLPAAIAPGARVELATLRYRPFSAPGSTEYQATLLGWLTYVDRVAETAATLLGTTGAADRGFDLEIWNELSFGSHFLDVNAYYAVALYQYDEQDVISAVLSATAEHVAADRTRYAGVALTDGFASTTPWPAASTTPARVTALSKHPYPPRLRFPADEQHGDGLTGLNSLGESDPYTPTYVARFPEYFGTAIQTETLVRDLAPMSTTIDGTAHGRNARPSGPVETWITEANLAHDWSGMGAALLPDAIEPFKARIAARFAAFYLNKGASRLYLFGVNDAGPDDDVSLLGDAFLTLARRPGATYPAEPDAYVSLPLRVLARMSNQFSAGLDRSMTATRQITVASVADTHDHAQFAGDGTDEHPPLYDRDILAILPFQSNARRFVIPYYVMTRDVLQPFDPEQFTVRLQGLRGTAATVASYDPLGDTDVPVETVAADANSLTLRLTATDYPYLLTVVER